MIGSGQAIFSAVFYFSSVSLYQGFLMVGYATIYTMLPVFALVLDTDVTGLPYWDFFFLSTCIYFQEKLPSPIPNCIRS